MKRILLTIVAIAAITLSAAAQGLQDIQSTSWYGGPSKSYVDRATSDIHLCIRKDGRKAWYSFNGGVHFMGYYEESITNSEKKILDKENPGWNNCDNNSNDKPRKKRKNRK